MRVARAALVLAGGDLVAWPYVGEHWDRVVCADSGARHALAYGLRPDLLVGDFDSITPDVRASLGEVPVRQFAADKDQTDSELALRAALEAHPDTVVIAGALGGRWDHAQANTALLRTVAQAGAHGVATDGRQFVFRIAGPGAWSLHGAPGDLFSIVPAGEPLAGLELIDARWELDGVELRSGSTLGVSNEFAQPVVTVRLTSGEAWLTATAQGEVDRAIALHPL